MDKILTISVKSKFRKLLETFVDGFEGSIEKSIKKYKKSGKIKISKERYPNEYVITLVGDEKIIKKLYEENKKGLKKAKLSHKVVMKSLGIKIIIKMR